MRKHRGNVGGDVCLAVAQADDNGSGPILRHYHQIWRCHGQNPDRVCAANLRECGSRGAREVETRCYVGLHQMGNNLRIRLGAESVPLGEKALFERQIVL